MKIQYSAKDLFFHLSIFKKINEKNRLDIFKASCRNNFRYLRPSNQNQQQALKNILKANKFQEIVFSKKILTEIDSEINYASLKSDSYLKKILEVKEYLQGFHMDKWTSSVALNIWLTKNDSCPFLHFAFDQWYDISQGNYRSLIPLLIDFSTSYLYRLSTTNNLANVRGDRLADGSHNCLFLIEKKGLIKKVPKSIAARYFINEQEVKTARFLLKSKLKKYIPHLVRYDENTKIITRQYISGQTGHELLTTNFFEKNGEAINDLKKFFDLYKKMIVKLKINLDIHPGNFVWSEEKQKWFLIDTGPIPLIGFEYFPLDSFESYFQKIWVERYQRIKKTPIRSVDLSF